jgi:hypothetical protein
MKKGVGRKLLVSLSVIFLLLIILVLPFVSAGFVDWFKDIFGFGGDDGLSGELGTIGPASGDAGELILHLDFENDVLDKSGNDNHGAGSATGYVDGKVGKAIKLAGGNDGILLPAVNSPSLYTSGAVTVSAWVNVNNIDKYNVIGLGLGPTNYFSAGGTGSRVDLLVNMMKDVVNNVNIWTKSSGIISEGVWTHVVFILEDGVGYKYYINGVLDSEESNSDIGFFDYSTEKAFKDKVNTIGMGFNDESFFEGSIDELKIWNKVLSSDEIQEEFLYDPSTCTDSDGGQVYDVKGTTTGMRQGQLETHVDNCFNPTSVHEGYCRIDPNGNDLLLESGVHQCPNGCFDGACLLGQFLIINDGETIDVGGHTINVDIIDGENAEITIDGESDIYLEGLQRAFTGGILTLINVEGPSLDGTIRNIELVIEFSESTICTDSDGGIDVSTKGTVDNGSITNIDYCNGNNIVEYICINNDIKIASVISEGYPCTDYGIYMICEDGACISNSPNSLCTDSDGGKVFNLKGEVISAVNGIRAIDFCDEDGKLVEYRCFNENSIYPGSTIISCQNGCQDGACVEKPQVCEEFLERMSNPKSYIEDGTAYDLEWNHTKEGNRHINGNLEEYTEYRSAWQILGEENGYNYFDYEVLVFDNKNINLDSWLDGEVEEIVCQVKEFWNSQEQRHKVYICNYDILNDRQSFGEEGDNSLVILWTNNNVAIRIHTHSGKKLSQEDIMNLFQEDIYSFFDSLKDNEFEFIGWDKFDLYWKMERQISQSLSECISEVPEDTCNSYWECKTEPIICPPHGSQTRICRDVSDCNFPNIERTSSCSPGICEGCFIPRNKFSNENVCIPYGTRFVFEEGEEFRISEDEMNRESDGIFGVEILDSTSMKIEVINDYGYNDVSITVDGFEEYNIITGETKTVFEGRTYELTINDRGNIEEYSFSIKEINYDEDPSKRYIDFIFNDKYSAYCNYDGKVKQQKIKDYEGNWAKCQNNYECDSNLCSGGECVEINDAIKKAKGYKVLVIKIICKLGNMFEIDDYQQCVVDRLGE